MSKNYKKKYKPYKRGQVVYVDFGWKPEGVQCFIRPAVIVSSNQSNHNNAPQITVCPLSSKLKDIDVHVNSSFRCRGITSAEDIRLYSGGYSDCSKVICER